MASPDVGSWSAHALYMTSAAGNHECVNGACDVGQPGGVELHAAGGRHRSAGDADEICVVLRHENEPGRTGEHLQRPGDVEDLSGVEGDDDHPPPAHEGSMSRTGRPVGHEWPKSLSQRPVAAHGAGPHWNELSASSPTP
jgi:hypothetical protein